MKSAALHQRLESLYATYHRPCYLAQDPLIKVLPFHRLADREIVALLAAGLAYGRVASILNSIDDLLARLTPSPSGFVRDLTPRGARAALRGFKHRWTTGEEVARLLLAIHDLQQTGESMEDALVTERAATDATILPALGPWVRRLTGGTRNSLLADPAGGSACKRMCLFLRWMVRQDAIDPGGWTRIPPSLLVVPVDVHMHRIARQLRLTQRNQGDLTTALEITDAFRRIRPQDPTRYDFALTRPGILGEGPVGRRAPRPDPPG